MAKSGKASILNILQAWLSEVCDDTRLPGHTPKWKLVCGRSHASFGSVFDHKFLSSLISNSYSSIYV